jgi:hypothetical protein
MLAGFEYIPYSAFVPFRSVFPLFPMKLSSRPGKSSLLFPVLVIALIALVVFIDARRRSAERQLQELSVQLGNVGDQQQNRERAKEIVDEVRKIMDVPTDVEPTVATIVDVNKLRESNPFYNKAENGDYLIVTPTRAILYSSSKRVILDVVPVQLEQAAAQSSSAR